jgi:hypothetical protein
MNNIFNQAFGQQPGGYTYGANLGDTSQNAYNLWGSTGPTNPYIARAATQAPLVPQNVADVLPGGANYYDWNNTEEAREVAKDHYREGYINSSLGGGNYVDTNTYSPYTGWGSDYFSSLFGDNTDLKSWGGMSNADKDDMALNEVDGFSFGGFDDGTDESDAASAAAGFW